MATREPKSKPAKRRGASANGTSSAKAKASSAKATNSASKPLTWRGVSSNGASSAKAERAQEPEDETGADDAARRDRYRRLPAGVHGLDPEEVRRDQRERLQTALVELIAERGCQAVRILDLTKLARVSRPTFYSLYADKEELFLATYDEIAMRMGNAIMKAYGEHRSPGEGLRAAMHAWAGMAAAEPEGVSLLVLGSLGAGPRALERRNRTVQALEQGIGAARSAGGRDGRATGRESTAAKTDLTVKVILGGIREVTAARLRRGQAAALPGLADELATWADSYPAKLPAGLESKSADDRQRDTRNAEDAEEVRATPAASERARQAEGRLPSGRHDLPRQFIVKNQRERIVDATAAIVAEKGLSGLTIPEIARRANVSHQTFYEMYPTKHDAFMGAQKVGLHQALGITVQAYEAQGGDWPMGVAAGLSALLDYLASEPAHAHLTIVDTFAASPLAIEIRDTGLHAFASYLQPGYHHAPPGRSVAPIAPEAIAGGIWQVLHNHIQHERVEDIAGLAPQLVFLALAPFLGSKEAARVARKRTVAAPRARAGR